MRPVSQRVSRVTPSQTTAFTALVAAERLKGREIIDLAVGEYPGPAPAAVIAATQAALAEGRYRYGPVAGLPALRDALARRYPGTGADNVIITNGAKQALFHIFQALCDPGAEVIIPTPCWVSFPQMVRLAGGHPVMVPCDRRHQPDIEGIRSAVSERTCAILVNSPNNPTGAVYPEAAMVALMEIARTEGLTLISDETYAELVYDDCRHSSVASLTGSADHVILVGSFSKSFTMTGFRVGYAIAPAPVITAMTVIQSHACGNVCTFAQYGALAAMELPEASRRELRATLAANRDVALEIIGNVLPCTPPQGAFYLFPEISSHLRPGASASDFCTDMLRLAAVALVPGEAFGVHNHIRISFAVDGDDLREGLGRMMAHL
ncbi:MAG: pyridoxal phosphate-dependent aminotransferase [Pseudomonadota bacterium]